MWPQSATRTTHGHDIGAATAWVTDLSAKTFTHRCQTNEALYVQLMWRQAGTRSWWLLAAAFGLVGILWLLTAIFLDNDPYLWLRYGVPVLWFVGAVVAVIRARRSKAL